MGDRTRRPVMYGSPSSPRDETVTPPNEPVMSSDADERESFRRVSDTLEILQLNIDTHLRDLYTHRAFHLNSPPPIPSPTESDFLPSTVHQPEQQQTQDDASESRASTPDSFELPIMQFESPPASSDPVREPAPESSESSERESFEEWPFELDMASLRAFFNPVAPNPVTEAYEPLEPESFEVPIMLDIASVQAFSNPGPPGSANESSELLQPESFEVPIMLDVASVQTFSNPVASSPNPVAERFELRHPDTFEIPEMSPESSPAVSSSVPAYDSTYESFALQPPEYFEIPTTLDESLAVVPSHPVVSDAQTPSPNTDTSYPELVTHYSELAVRQSDLSAYHSDIGARHSVLAARESIIAAHQPNLAAHHSSLAASQSIIAARHFDIATRYFDIATEYSQVMANYFDLATHHPDSTTLPDPATPPGLATPPPTLAIHPPDPLATHLSNLLHPDIGSPHTVASGPMAPGLEPETLHLVTRPSHADNSSSVSHGHSAASHTLPQPNLTTSIENATAGDEPTPFNQGIISHSPERMVQAWLQRQQVLVGIPVGQIQSMTISGHQQVQRAAPWIVLTEEGAFARRLPPIKLNATNNPALSTTAVSSNTSNESVPSTGTTYAPGSSLAVSSHTLDGSKPSASTTSAAGLSSAVLSNTPNAPNSSTAATDAANSSSPIGTLPTSLLGSPVGTNPTTVPSSPAGRVPILYQLVLIAPEELATPSTPTRSAVRSEWDPTRDRFSNHLVGSSDIDPRLGRVRSLPRSSSSPSALSSPVIVPSSSVVASWDLPFLPIPPVDSSPTSDSESGLQRTWSSRHAPEGMYQDPRATVFLTPLASFVATQPSPPAPSVLSSGPLGVVNRDEADSISDEEVEVTSPSSEEESDSPRSSTESSPEEGVKTPNGGYTNGVHPSAQRRFLIDGADDSPDEASEQDHGEEKEKEPTATAAVRSQADRSRHRLKESWVFLEAPMRPLSTTEWEDRESALKVNLEAGSGFCESAELSPRVLWPEPRSKEENAALVMEQEAIRPSLRDGEEMTEAEKAKVDHPWNYD